MNEDGHHIVPDRTRRQSHTRKRQAAFFTQQKSPSIVQHNVTRLLSKRQIVLPCISDVAAIYEHCVRVCLTKLSHGNTVLSLNYCHRLLSIQDYLSFSPVTAFHKFDACFRGLDLIAITMRRIPENNSTTMLA